MYRKRSFTSTVEKWEWKQSVAFIFLLRCMIMAGGNGEVLGSHWVKDTPGDIFLFVNIHWNRNWSGKIYLCVCVAKPEAWRFTGLTIQMQTILDASQCMVSSMIYIIACGYFFIILILLFNQKVLQIIWLQQSTKDPELRHSNCSILTCTPSFCPKFPVED